MKIHFRFFLSHVNSEKISIFHEKSMYFEKIPRENRPEASALRDVIMLLLMTSLAKERETAVKSIM